MSALFNRNLPQELDRATITQEREGRSPLLQGIPSAQDRSRVDESTKISVSCNGAAGSPNTAENTQQNVCFINSDENLTSFNSISLGTATTTVQVTTDTFNDSIVTNEIFKLSEHGLKIHDVRRSDDHNHLLETKTTPKKEGGLTKSNKVGFQLRALSESGSSLSAHKTWAQQGSPINKTVSRTKDIHVPFSTELVTETLNYFVNCQQRLNQMTKTYDDSDAYLLLLQEKEVDLELAARIGQDLLKQNNELKETLKQVEKELADRTEDVQQLKHELATKVSLLETFREEEEDEYNSSNIETPHATVLCNKSSDTTQKLVENVTSQLVESNKRLYDEVLFKGEQSLLQQEKIFRLEEQLRDSDRRLDDVATENETLRKSMLQAEESRNEVAEELRICKRNFSDLLAAFLEMQKESRINRNLEQVPTATFYGEVDLVNDINNISFDSFTDIPPQNHQQEITNLDSFNGTVDSGLHITDITSSISPTNLSTNTDMEEGREVGDSSGEDAQSTLGDSLAGAHVDYDYDDEYDDDEYINKRSIAKKKGWLNFSSFMLSTVVLLCLSATFNSTTNSNLASRIHQLRLQQ